jgi:VacB/RNase II family 3'-5' exoribonuclease
MGAGPMHPSNPSHVDLQAAAAQVMVERGFDPVEPPGAAQQLDELRQHPPPVVPGGDVRDLRRLLWSSIDNDTSRDLDQLEVAEALPDATTKVMVAIADVDAYVPKGSPIDRHAAQQTMTVYTGVRNFSMLPEPLSTGATSLLEGGDRLAIVIELVVDGGGHVHSSAVYRAVVRNAAQLAYHGVGAWLEGRGPAPAKVAASADLQAQLRLQNSAAQALRTARYGHGALNIETIEVRPVLHDAQVVGLDRQDKNHATELIEDLMIASNEIVALLLEDRKVSSIRRVVKAPKRWDRIVELAATLGGHLPAAPDSKALNDFLLERKAADPDRFADLSLAVIKLLGPGEYVLDRPGDPPAGHFGLAVEDYTHSTAPNRRFADLVTQRLVKAVLAGRPAPYSDEELADAAAACTLKENAARKVEREMTKRIAAVAMSGRIGDVFDAVVTGVTASGTFVRILTPHVEGLLAQGQQGVDVGDRLRVRLIRADVARGFIDFARLGPD